MVNDPIKVYREAVAHHEEAALLHDQIAQHWLNRGDQRRAELERRNAQLERDAAQIERDKLALVEEEEASNVTPLGREARQG